METETLLNFNREGLIPGPEETEAAFEERARYCLNFQRDLISKIQEQMPFGLEDLGSEVLLKEAFPTTQQLYDITPSWIPIFFSNHQLAVWHGGCAWIFQLAEETPMTALFQLRKQLRSQTRYLRIYTRDELLAHELAHVGRMQFEEPKFEEMLAYRSSKSSFRKWFGPIIQSAKESILFVLTLFIVLVFDVFLLATGSSEAFVLAMWAQTLPLALISLALGRLGWRHFQFSRCLKALRTCLSVEKVNGVIYRLTDEEIIQMGKLTTKQIGNYAREMAPTSLRWRLLQEAYFRNPNR